MKFIPLASSSAGNAYLASCGGVGFPLLIEAGIPIKALRRKLMYHLPDLAGCLVSHEHGDHAKAVPDLLRASVHCYMSAGTATVLGVRDHHRVTCMKPGKVLTIMGWAVIPFGVEHDAAEPFGFFVSDGEERLLFVPDTAFVKYRFRRINIVAIECNHISDILNENVIAGAVPSVVGKRVRRNHLSLNNVIEMLKANDLRECREIHLIHLSDRNSDEARMILEVQQATGIPTYAA